MKLKFKEIGLTNLLIMIISFVFVVISAVMIFVGEFNLVYLLYGINIVAINLGILMIVQYFTTDAYKNSNAYGFSMGAMIVFLSVFIIIKAVPIAENTNIILALFLLLSGVVVLQYSMDLHRIKAFISSVILLAGILMIISAVMVIWQPISDKIPYDKISWWMVFISGILSIFSDIFTMIRVRLFNKRVLQEEELLGGNVTGNSDSQKVNSVPYTSAPVMPDPVDYNNPAYIQQPTEMIQTPEYTAAEDKTVFLGQNNFQQ